MAAASSTKHLVKVEEEKVVEDNGKRRGTLRKHQSSNSAADGDAP